ncbi:MAG: nuclear transport factor 2 family protein, partial [Pseudomonas sp.]|nr:nuclear transport factor 2 family protein [Pseudomonas sp.]
MSVTQDKSEIIDVIDLLGVALDTHAWDLLDEVFTEDAHADFGPAGAVWQSVGALKFAFKDFHET